jgi:uncharacterized protein (TIGR00369 family)
MASKITAEQANAFLEQAFSGGGKWAKVTQMGEGTATMELEVKPYHLRPGGFISGPTQMSLADSVVYMALMTRIGIVPMAVTSNLNINFLRPCLGEVVVASAEVMKLGRSLAIVEVDVRGKGMEKPASHAVVTYAIPPKTSA